jgi:hypothetical protein
VQSFRVSVLLGSSFALGQNSVQFLNKNHEFFRVLLLCGLLRELAPVVVGHGWTSYTRHQATLDLVLGLYNIEHPEIAAPVIVNSIAKRGSQTSFKKSALLSSRALFSFQIASRLVPYRACCFKQE